MHGDFWRLFFYLFRIQDFLGFRLLLGYSEGIFQRSLKSLHGHFRFIQVTSGASENVGYIWEGRGDSWRICGILELFWKGFWGFLENLGQQFWLTHLTPEGLKMLRMFLGILKVCWKDSWFISGVSIYFRIIQIFEDFWRFSEILWDSIGLFGIQKGFMWDICIFFKDFSIVLTDFRGSLENLESFGDVSNVLKDSRRIDGILKLFRRDFCEFLENLGSTFDWFTKHL